MLDPIRVFRWVVVLLVGLTAPRIAAAGNIDVQVIPAGKDSLRRIRVVAHRESMSKGGTQDVGGGSPDVVLTIYEGEYKKTKQQLLTRTRRKGEGFRLVPNTSGCVFAHIDWTEKSKLEGKFFLPTPSRVKLCPGRVNQIDLERKEVPLTAVVEPAEGDDVEPTEGACVEARLGPADEWKKVRCAPVGQDITWTHTRKSPQEDLLELRTAMSDDRYASTAISLDIGAAGRGETTTASVPLGPRIRRKVELWLPRRAVRGWGTPEARELDELCVPSTAEFPRFPESARPKSCTHDGSDAKETYACTDLQWLQMRGTRSIFTARCPLPPRPDQQPLQAHGPTEDHIACELREGVCRFQEYFHDPRRELQICLNEVAAEMLEDGARLDVTIERFNASGSSTTRAFLRKPEHPGTTSNGGKGKRGEESQKEECPGLAHAALALDDEDKESDKEKQKAKEIKKATETFEEQFGDDDRSTRYTVTLTGSFTNYPYRYQGLVLQDRGRAIDVFDRPLQAQDLKVRSFSVGVRLLAIGGAGIATGEQTNAVLHAEGGGAFHADAQWFPRKLPTVSFGLLYGYEVVRTRDWIEYAPGEFDPRFQWRGRAVLGPRVELSRPLFKGVFYRTEFHGAWAPEFGGSPTFHPPVGLVGLGFAVDLSRRIPWLSFYFGTDVLFGSRSELRRFEDTSSFSTYSIQSPKLRVLAGLAWYPAAFTRFHSPGSTRAERRRSR